MLKKTIKYTNYNDVEVTKDCYFNLTKTELAEMELGKDESISDTLRKIINSKSAPGIMENVKYLIMKSYGEKSADGDRFVKSDELSTAFTQTEAYNVLFMELLSDANKCADFVNGIMPKDIAAKVATMTEEEKTKLLEG